MSDRLTPEREAEIDYRAAHLYEYSNRHDSEWDVLAGEDVPALLAELAAVRAERDQARAELAKYVGKEPTVVEEMAYLNRCLNAVYDLCDEAKRSNSLGITIEAVEQAADGQRANDPDDNRRRLYVDGKGNGWIDAGVDSGGRQWIASIDDRVMEATRESVTAETGSLREIGRCW